jgi:hypothetical protein
MTNLHEPESSPVPHLGGGALRLSAVDLRDLSEAEHAALRQAAIRDGITLPELLGKVVAEASRRMLNMNQASPTA